MRLIDADALKAEWPEPTDWMDRDQVLCHITWFRAVIDNQPTIDPVKRGRWEMLMGWPFPEWRCSQCGNHICGDKEHLKKWNYCPNCGARMDVPDTNVGETKGEEG